MPPSFLPNAVTVMSAPCLSNGRMGSCIQDAAYLKSGFAFRWFTSATSSMTGPREALIRMASFCIMFNRSSFIRCRVFSSRLQCRLTTYRHASAASKLEIR